MFIISKIGVKVPQVYWKELQESPIAGKWVANSKKATKFSRNPKVYLKKYINEESATIEEI